MDTWISRMVRARCARRATAWAVAVACVVLVGFAQQRYVKNFLMGPYVLGTADLDSISDVSKAPRYFVRVTGSKAIDTGIQEVTAPSEGSTDTSRPVPAEYYALVMDDRLLVCKSRSGLPITTAEGELEPMPADLAKQIFSEPEAQGVRERFYSFYVNDKWFPLHGYEAIAGLLVFGYFLIRRGLPALRHILAPESHPTTALVATWGDPIGVALAAELEAGSPRFKGLNDWTVGNQFLICPAFFNFEVLRLTDLLWGYKAVTKHRVNFIPTGKTYDAVLVCYGGTATIQGNEETVDEILAFAAQRIPWAVFGFSKKIQECFRKSTRDFCNAVEQRKHDWAQQQARP
jgi:hypothetical protein